MLCWVLSHYFFLIVEHKNSDTHGYCYVNHGGLETHNNYLNKKQGKNKIKPSVIEPAGINQAVYGKCYH